MQSAVAGPADAACVYLALGCDAPTVRPLIPLLSTDLPANNPDLASLPPPVETAVLPPPAFHRRHRHHHFRARP